MLILLMLMLVLTRSKDREDVVENLLRPIVLLSESDKNSGGEIGT